VTGKKDKNKPVLSKKDTDLWKAVTKDVRRMPGRDYEEGAPEIEDDIPSVTIKERIGIKSKEQPKGPRSKEVDARTKERLARGKMKIEGTLDLHGMSQDEARTALSRFIKSSHTRGRRCVLVITGKGRGGKPGVLRTRVPEWLDEEPLGALVLQISQAKHHDGGEGALYVLLRRQRG
jgi:DNA-nicking Smr family endonuclease